MSDAPKNGGTTEPLSEAVQIEGLQRLVAKLSNERNAAVALVASLVESMGGTAIVAPRHLEACTKDEHAINVLSLPDGGLQITRPSKIIRPSLTIVPPT